MKKAVTPFFLPPGIIIVLLLITALAFLIRKRWTAGLTNLVIGMMLWALSTNPVSSYLLRGIEGDFKIPENPRGDVIILLGGGVYGDVPDLSGTGTPSEEMDGRIITAVRLQKKLNIPVIISGGSVQGKKAEAPIVKRFLADLGVPLNKILMEAKSRDTIENAKYTCEICRKQGYRKPLLVTSAFHMKRAITSFEKIDCKVLPVPAAFKAGKQRKYGWEDFLPDISALEGTTLALHEYVGFLFYKIAY